MTPASARRMGFLMGTWVTAEAEHAAEAAAREAVDEAFREMKHLDALLNRFAPASAVSRINRDAHSGAVEAGGEVFEALEAALGAAEASGGAVDVASGSLSDLWKTAEERGRCPSREEIRKALDAAGWKSLSLDPARRTVRFLKEGMRLDFGAVGKGWILDRAARAAKNAGAAGIYLDAGGHILCRGTGESRIGIRNPLRPKEISAVVSARDASVSTSANDERFYRIGGRLYGHLLDPRTGFPADGGLVSVSVVAPDAFTADALSTAIFVLGMDRGVPLAERLGAREIIALRSSRGFRGRSVKAEHIWFRPSSSSRIKITDLPLETVA